MGSSTSLRPFAIHLGVLLGLIAIIGAIVQWSAPPAPLRDVMGIATILTVGVVNVLPRYYLDRFNVGTACDPSGTDDTGEVDSDVSQHSTSPLQITSESSLDTCNQNQFVSFYGRNMPLYEVMQTWRVYGIMLVLACISGSGLLVTNNIQAIAEATGQIPSPFFVSILSLANSLGRVLVGYVADYMAHTYSRLQILSFVAAIMGITQFILSFGSAVLFYPCLLVVGGMFGASFSNVSAIMADLYGPRHIGANYGNNVLLS